jgi:hypothetical protein
MLPILNNIVSLINTNLRIVTHYINYIKPILNYIYLIEYKTVLNPMKNYILPYYC